MGRLDGGAVAVMITEDDVPRAFRRDPYLWLREPLDLKRVGKLHALQVFDALEATPLAWETDITSPRYREVRLWSITADGLTAWVHGSRVLHFRGAERPPSEARGTWFSMTNMPDDSVIQALWDDLSRLSQTMAGGATLAQELRERVLKLANLPALATEVGAFALALGSRDAAVQQTSLANGAYTVQVSSVTPGQTGTALAEIFDASSTTSGARQLVNVSARAQVAASDNPLIAGFVISGSTARTVLIRAAGPALAGFGVAGALSDPTLTLFRESTRLAESDNWQTSAELVNAFAAAGAFNFNARSRDAVILMTLPPGAYTAQVSGVATITAGVALIEIYALP